MMLHNQKFSPPVYWICFIDAMGEKELLEILFFDEKLATRMAKRAELNRPDDSVIVNRLEDGVYSTCLFSISCSWIRATGMLRDGLAGDLLKIRNGNPSQPKKPLEKSPFKFLCDGTAGLLQDEDEDQS